MKLYWIKSFRIKEGRRSDLRCDYVTANNYGEAESKFRQQIDEWTDNMEYHISEIELLAEEGQYAKPNIIII